MFVFVPQGSRFTQMLEEMDREAMREQTGEVRRSTSSRPRVALQPPNPPHPTLPLTRPHRHRHHRHSPKINNLPSSSELSAMTVGSVREKQSARDSVRSRSSHGSVAVQGTLKAQVSGLHMVVDWCGAAVCSVAPGRAPDARLSSNLTPAARLMHARVDHRAAAGEEGAPGEGAPDRVRAGAQRR